MVFCLARTELTEVLGGLRDYVCEEFELNSAQWLACQLVISTRYI